MWIQASNEVFIFKAFWECKYSDELKICDEKIVWYYVWLTNFSWIIDNMIIILPLVMNIAYHHFTQLTEILT